MINVIGRRSRGWGSTTVLNDVVEYLDTTQNLMNMVDAGGIYYVRSTSSNDCPTARAAFVCGPPVSG